MPDDTHGISSNLIGLLNAQTISRLQAVFNGAGEIFSGDTPAQTKGLIGNVSTLVTLFSSPQVLMGIGGLLVNIVNLLTLRLNWWRVLPR